MSGDAIPPQDEDELAALLAMALDDGADPVRLRLMTALIMLRHDEDREIDLDRLRTAITIPTVTRL